MDRHAYARVCPYCYCKLHSDAVASLCSRYMLLHVAQRYRIAVSLCRVYYQHDSGTWYVHACMHYRMLHLSRCQEASTQQQHGWSLYGYAYIACSTATLPVACIACYRQHSCTCCTSTNTARMPAALMQHSPPISSMYCCVGVLSSTAHLHSSTCY